MSNKSLKEWNPKYDWNGHDTTDASEPLSTVGWDAVTGECDPLTVADLIRDSTAIATAHGFTEQSFGECIALIHSELSEALEEFRNRHQFNEVYMNGDKPEGIPIELADAVIRIAHCCGRFGIDLESAIRVKQEYNMTRPIRHGDKRL